MPITISLSLSDEDTKAIDEWYRNIRKGSWLGYVRYIYAPGHIGSTLKIEDINTRKILDLHWEKDW